MREELKQVLPMNKEILEAAWHCAEVGCGIDCKLYRESNCAEIFARAIVDHHEKYRWHDLRKDPYDLPFKGFREYVPCLIVTDGSSVPQYAEWACFEGRGFGFFGFRLDSIIAWREFYLEPFESEE